MWRPVGWECQWQSPSGTEHTEPESMNNLNLNITDGKYEQHSNLSSVIFNIQHLEEKYEDKAKKLKVRTCSNFIWPVWTNEVARIIGCFWHFNCHCKHHQWLNNLLKIIKIQHLRLSPMFSDIHWPKFLWSNPRKLLKFYLINDGHKNIHAWLQSSMISTHPLN